MNKIHVLLVEDNEGDILLTKEAFEERGILKELSIVKNGKAALDFLFKRGEFADSNTPDLILMDINLPIKSGHDVLEEIKQASTIKKIPVIMLTTSSSQKDIDKAYENHANSYIIKPLEMEDFLEIIKGIENYWLELVKFANLNNER